jgi:acylpyruvate hydrolase
MRLGIIANGNRTRLLAARGERVFRLDDPAIPVDPLAILLDAELQQRVNRGAAESSCEVDLASATLLPPLAGMGKIICAGLNYADHAAESPYAKPDYPVYFLRVDTSIVGHNAPIIRPRISDRLDFEGEIVAVIGKAGRYISLEDALDHVAGYSLFNDGSIRDYQFKGPQWTLGKNFDATGPFGPLLVSADELPQGIQGLRLRTLLNGQVVQDASTSDLLFPVAELIARASEAMTLKPGDLIVTGTPAGVGFARKPPLFMKHGDVCEVEVQGIGTLRNPIRDQA